MSWLQRFIRGRSRRSVSQAASDLRDQIMATARTPELYEKEWLPDTIDGRFHAVCLHAALVFPRLERAGEDGSKVSVALNEALFDSFDAALRETGVGDASIARRIRKMGETFVGLGRAVSTSLQHDEAEAQLADVLVRNGITDAESAPALASYIRGRDDRLSDMPEGDLLNGSLAW